MSSDEIKFEVGQRYGFGDSGEWEICVTAIHRGLIQYDRYRAGNDFPQRDYCALENACNKVRIGHWRRLPDAAPAAANYTGSLTLTHQPIPARVHGPHTCTAADTLVAIQALLPAELAQLGVIRAVTALVESYAFMQRQRIRDHEHDDPHATIDRMRRERVASVMPVREPIASDNDDASDGW